MAISFSQKQIDDRIRFENIWWETKTVENFYKKMAHREYFKLFYPLVIERTVKRAVVLMGPRRVGKTVMLFQSIQKLIDSGVDPRNICYFSIETPIYNKIALEELLNMYFDLSKKNRNDDVYIFFDEIQYLKDWEVHLKSLVDSYHNAKFIVSGSAAAALKLKSNESGAGRFTDFILPPLTFHEYLILTNNDAIIKDEKGLVLNYSANDIEKLNRCFVDYINYGGYPEVSLSETIQQDPGRYIRNDIIDKVLLRDLPSLYGIQDVQELNSLFTYIAYNSGNEMSLEGLASSSGIAKNTIKKYITYLEASFLITVINRIDNNAKKFKRANFFKIYLTNPSLRSALFSPINSKDEFMGNMVETAIFSQWKHSENMNLHYARWQKGEVDLVCLDGGMMPEWAVEIKWTNRFVEKPNELKNLKMFCESHHLNYALITTIDIEKQKEMDGFIYEFAPASLYCYAVGRNLISRKFSNKEYIE